jgi:O-antigen/teichoic acid export membrane protein
MTRLNKEGKHDELLATYQGLTKWMTMLGIPIFTVLFFAPEVAIGFLFGSRYTDGALVLQILAVGKLISLLAGLNFNSLVALGDNRIVAYLMFVQILLNFAATYLLIPVYGIEGAAAALVGSAAAGDALGATVLFKRYGVHPVHRSLFLPVALLGSVAAAGYVAITVSGLPLWLVAVPVGLGYPLVVVRFAVESRDEVLLGLFEDRIGRELTPIRAVVSRLQ